MWRQQALTRCIYHRSCSHVVDQNCTGSRTMLPAVRWMKQSFSDLVCGTAGSVPFLHRIRGVVDSTTSMHLCMHGGWDRCRASATWLGAPGGQLPETSSSRNFQTVLGIDHAISDPKCVKRLSSDSSDLNKSHIHHCYYPKLMPRNGNSL